MKKKKLFFATIAAVLIVVLLVIADSRINVKEKDEVQIKAYQQHKVALENGVNPNLGTVDIPNDYIVDSTFESHLPLVIIDVNNQEIKKTRKIITNEDGSQTITETGAEPYTMGSISIIDNANYDNKLSDEPQTASNMKIKLRGSSSQSFDKKQYAIKMLDEDGNSKKVDVMGMGADNDWILNISMLDGSLMRNYTAYMFGSALFPGTPDCRYCEVLFKVGDNQYEYIGVYLMMEKIEQSVDRVNIEKYKSGDKLVSYLLCRDREDSKAKQLSTYGSVNKLAYGRISVLYPEDEKLDDYAFNFIQSEIDAIERALYSDDLNLFTTWTEYLDEQSFVDYFLFNSIFRNYDAGNNSTYMYKNLGGKLCMGPVWDYDNANNNDYNAIQVPDHDYFSSSPWFDRLIYSKQFVKALEYRYKELKSGIFDAEYIRQYTKDVEAFLGNAAERDWKRWSKHYGENSAYSKSYGLVDSEGFVVDRRTESFSDDVERYGQYFVLEEQYLDINLREYEEYTFKSDSHTGSYFAIMFAALLVCLIVLIGRRKMFR